MYPKLFISTETGVGHLNPAINENRSESCVVNTVMMMTGTVTIAHAASTSIVLSVGTVQKSHPGVKHVCSDIYAP